MKLNRTGSNWNRLERNKINENWDIIEGSYNDVVGQITDEVVGHLIDSAKLIWKEPVDTVEDLPTNAEVGETRMVREADPDGVSYVYRYDGENWEKIQEIDVTLVNEVDSRLSDKIEKEYEQRRYESMISRKNPKIPMITIVDDDGWAGVYTVLFELAKEFNVPITSAMITGRPMGFPGDTRTPDPKYYNYSQVMEMRDSNLIEFISHTHSNLLAADASEDDLREDLAKSKSFLEKYGLNHRAIAFPGGKYDEKSLKVAKEFFDYGVGSATSTDAGKRIVTPPVNNYRLGRYRGDGTNSIDNISDMMDETVELNGWLILTTHIGQTEGTNEDHIRAIITTALSKGLKFVKLEEGVRTHGNIAQFGGTNMNPETTISSDGIITGNRLGRTIFDTSNTVNGSTHVSEFEKNTKTITRVSANKGGFPQDDSGILETVRMNNDLWSYQRFITNRTGLEYIRNWDYENDKWGTFDSTTKVWRSRPDWVKIDTKASEFPRGVTIVNLDGDYQGSPTNSPGVLITVKTHSTVGGYNFQIFKAYSSLSQYVRYEYINGGWSSWSDLSPIKLAEFNDFTGETKRDEFSEGITYSIIRGNEENKGTPNDAAGTLITHIVGNNPPAFNFQEFHWYNSETGRVFKRYGSSSEFGWGDWIKIAGE